MEASRGVLIPILTLLAGLIPTYCRYCPLAGNLWNYRPIGVIKREELSQNWMQNPIPWPRHNEHGKWILKFINKIWNIGERGNSAFFGSWKKDYGPIHDFLRRSNSLAVKRLWEILTSGRLTGLNVILPSVGTGGTLLELSIFIP